MKKTVLRLAVALFTSFILFIGIKPEQTLAATGRTCNVRGCSSYCSQSSWYCYRHECSKTSCHSKATDQGYCKTHAKKSSSLSNKSSSKKSTYSKSKHKKSYSYDWPDCDDYEDYDDFMDDWDGCMPDDSDAEDYWDNW